MKRLLGPVAALCLSALLLACGGGSDDADNRGVTILAVPTRSADALGDFGGAVTPLSIPTLTIPTVSPTAPPAATSTPQPPAVAATQAPAATSTSLPAPPAAPATPSVVVFGTPGPNNTFTYGAGPSSGPGSCAPAGSTQAGPGGQQPMSLQGNPPPGGQLPGGPPPGGSAGNQVFSTGVGGADPMAGLASFLGVSTAQLQSELSQAGATQSSVAARHGKSRDQLKAFLVEQTRKQTAEAVSKRQMTQTQATQLVAQYAADVDKVIDGTGACAGGPITFAPGPAR